MAVSKDRFRRKKIISIILIALSMLIVIIIFSARAVKKRNLQKAESEKMVVQAVPVRVQEAKPSDAKVYIRSSATVQAWQESLISSEISGRVKSVDAKVGDSLSKGSIILRIDDELLKYRLEDTKGRLLQLEANYLQCKSDLKRKENLYKNKIIPEYDLETARAREKGDKGLLLSARASLNIAKRDLRETDIRSPIDGILAERYVDLGTNVLAGQKVASVVLIKKVKISIGVTDVERSKIVVGQKVEIRSGSYPETIFYGKVYSIGLKADDTTLTYPVEIVVENINELKLNPGMFVKVSILVSNISDVISIPQSILESTSKGDFVWAVVGNKAVKKSVVIGAFSGTSVTIKEGLNPGDQIVVLGYENLIENCDVNVIK
jgi:membrane fusion protein (multidrug efflux system)